MLDALTTAPPAALERRALETELRHWRTAVVTLSDLDMVASPGAWAALESYLGSSVRASLKATTTRVATELDRVAAELALARSPESLALVRTALLHARHRYVQAETVVNFYGDAVNTRTNPQVGAVLRGLDALAVASMDAVLRPLHIETPPVLTYLDHGLGASILRAGARLWDASLSPAAAVKITHHNLWRPTSLMHETGHQVAHLTGWAPELGQAIASIVEPASRFAAEMWQSWASEVAADVYAFALLGYAPVPALATVVDGPARKVFRMPLGDPHPFGWIRVLFNVELCRSWYGDGDWDALGIVWQARHRPERAPADVQEVIRASVPLLRDIAAACTRAPMKAFGGLPLAALVDPRRVSPVELERLAQRAGPSLYTSGYLRRLEPMRILGWTVLRDLSGHAGAGRDLRDWLSSLDSEQSA